jgi:hypothetical protein
MPSPCQTTPERSTCYPKLVLKTQDNCNSATLPHSFPSSFTVHCTVVMEKSGSEPRSRNVHADEEWPPESTPLGKHGILFYLGIAIDVACILAVVPFLLLAGATAKLDGRIAPHDEWQMIFAAMNAVRFPFLFLFFSFLLFYLCFCAMAAYFSVISTGSYHFPHCLHGHRSASHQGSRNMETRAWNHAWFP